MNQSKHVVKQIGSYTYDEAKCLGEGTYGKVYEGVDSRTNETVAIKKLDLELFEKDKYLRTQIVQEIEIMRKFNHENIVKFIDLLTTKKSLYIVTEMCRDGDLKQLLQKKYLQESEIVQGFKEMVKIGIIHRDMKPANVLNHNGIVKIGDFGFAKYVENYNSQLLKSCVGSPLYMAPQILARQTYSTKCDIWALGVIYYEMLFHDVPWKGKDEDDLLKNIRTKAYKINQEFNPSQFSLDFLSQTLVVDEEQRITWAQVFEWFDKLDGGSSNAIAGLSSNNISYKDIWTVSEYEDGEEQIQKVPAWMKKNNEVC